MPTADVALVGRERELAELTAALDQAVDGRGRMTLLVGAPGIGKSRLAAALGDVARQRDVTVLSGRCWADAGTRPYWPWVQVLRTYLRQSTMDEVRHLAAGAMPELAHVLPEIGSAPVPDADTDRDPDVARFRVFDAVARFLTNTADRRPLLILLEDLHAADTPSLLLLRFVVSQLADTPILITATYRDLDLAPTDPRAGIIEQLTRDPNTVATALSGLSAGDSARLIGSTIGSRPDSAVVSALWRETRGNPLFLGQAVRLLALEGRLASADAIDGIVVAVPTEVREVILRRTEHLGPLATRVLSRAAVLGPEFELESLRAVAEIDVQDARRLLTDAVTAGLLAHVPGSPGQYRFAHDLIRESLDDVLDPADRVALHARIVESLEERHADALSQYAPVLAYHALEAARGRGVAGTPGPAGSMVHRALQYARLAGDQALRSSAWEEAARLYRGALIVGDRHHGLDDRDRLDLLLAIGEAEARANNLEVARSIFLDAVELARRLGSPRDLARAALGYGGRLVWARSGGDVRLVPLLQEALVMLGGEDDRLRARLLVRLSCALRSERDAHAQSAALSQQAVDLARTLDDDLTLTYVLGGRAWAIWWPDNVAERMEIAREMLETALRADDAERAVDAHTMLALSYLDLGQLEQARGEIAEIDRLAGNLRQPAQRWLGAGQRVTVELAAGNFVEAERLMAFEIEEGAPVTYGRDDVSAARMHRYHLARERGSVDTVEPLVRASAAEFPWYPLHRGALANVLLDLGRVEEARAVIDALAHNEFEVFAEDNEWLIGVSMTAEAAARLGDRRHAGVLYRMLLPRSGRHAVGHPEGSVGATDRYLGLLARALGNADAAITHLEAAVQLNARMGLRPWTAHSQADLADLLAHRDAPGDAERVRQLRAEAIATARAVGMPVLERRLLDAPAEDGSAPEQAFSRDGASTFRREGEYWTITFDGVTSRLRDSRGLRHIARLLANPGQEVHALDLSSDGAATPVASRAVDGFVDAGGGAGPMLDASAKEAYRRRLEELREDREEAERWNDDARGSRVQAEIDVLTEQLAAAVGLGGRDRSAASNAERARVAVTRAIRSAIQRIGQRNDGLRQHLEATVHTGTFCAYRPDPRVATDWDVAERPPNDAS